MCGIVGMIGNENVSEVLLKGLERLEYRGYDSAGVYVANQNERHLLKAQGPIKQLAEKMTSETTGTLGIGHTRWATHGIPSEENAHPHVSQHGKVVLVHNGVIENYRSLKEDYLAGYQLVGETDTEVVANLIEQRMEAENLSVKEAFKQTLRLLQGSYAFALIDTNDVDTLYVAKNKSPLLIGCGTDFHLVGSDALAMIHQTNQFIELFDGDFVTLTTNSMVLEDAAGNVIDRAPYTAEIDNTAIDKGTYPFYMLKEIEEQPLVLRRLQQKYFDFHGNVLLDDTLLQEISASERIYIVACGTSYNAGLASKDFFETLTKVPVEVHLASEFGYYTPLLAKKPFFIYLSQSGETADSRQVLVKTNQLGAPSLAITNVPGSTLAREAKYALSLEAGPEIAVASTKAYTAQIALLSILAYAIQLEKEDSQLNLLQELTLVEEAMTQVLTQKEHFHQLAKDFFRDTNSAFFIGRGNDYTVSLEAALKLKEISYIQAEGFAAGELKHGTIALIEDGTPVIGLITSEVTHLHTRGNLEEVKSRGAKTLVISETTFAQASDQIILPKAHPLLMSLVSVVPTQLLAYYATLERGYDVDKPRNLAKSVTVE